MHSPSTFTGIVEMRSQPCKPLSQGWSVGMCVGAAVGMSVVGEAVGAFVGLDVGDIEGLLVTIMHSVIVPANEP
jgi:hypothetical protein